VANRYDSIINLLRRLLSIIKHSGVIYEKMRVELVSLSLRLSQLKSKMKSTQDVIAILAFFEKDRICLKMNNRLERPCIVSQ
jgi:hypothetical protein